MCERCWRLGQGMTARTHDGVGSFHLVGGPASLRVPGSRQAQSLGVSLENQRTRALL